MKPMILLSALLMASVASAGTPRFNIHDYADTWAGLGEGAILGQAFATTFILNVKRDGTATQILDSTTGRVDADCTIDVETNGLALLHCVDTTGPFIGAESDTHLVITDNGQRLVAWSAAPDFQFLLTANSFRQ